MLNIVQLNKYYVPVTGGIEAVVGDIAKGLAARTAMRVLVCNTDRETVKESRCGVSVTRVGILCKAGSMPVSFRYLAAVCRACRDADVLQLHMPFPWGDLALLLSGYKGKVVLWWHSDVVRQKKLLFFYKPLMRWTLRRADAIVVATQGHFDGSAFLKPYEDKLRIIPYGVKEEYLREGAVVAMQPARREGMMEILYIGRLVYYKGCEVLLDAFSRMREKNCRLTMIGEGPLRGALEKQAEALGVSVRVRFLGEVDTNMLKAELADCDFFVLPSVARSEAFGLVQIEAMAYGKPVINTNLPSGVPCVSLNGVTGITVEPEDSEALCRAMDTLASDAHLRETYGENGRKRVESEYRMEIMCDKVFALYQTLCGDGRA